ncbi:hypothetical protein [Tahibacter amnicola]|uniref:Uncharacterized protein n=1 Tax=Tahibacter amnicola TaxID=2976241 RepID=A0ABY6B9F7_9GAMM|nr:hypothetical protein [Tahibacter amnicola]UXI66166.1 hypothetical protein N4264_15565 [Tahibacter amnicola]
MSVIRWSVALAAAVSSFAVFGATIVVRDDANAVVADAEVWVDSVLRGKTSSNGEFQTALAPGNHIVVRKLIATSPSFKGNHDGNWAFRIWHTNIVQHNDGTWTDAVVSHPSATYEIPIRRSNAIIAFNFVASLEYNATPRNITQISNGFINASQHLFDVTDGQMIIENVVIYEDFRHFGSADARFRVVEWPHASGGGKDSVQGPGYGMNLPGARHLWNWDHPASARVIGHEFGHYVIGAFDEYSNDGGSAMCTVDRNGVPESHRASMMDHERDSTEICHEGNHNPATDQGRVLRQSVWETLAAYWDDDTLDLKTPRIRGGTNPGPTTVPRMFATKVRIEESPDFACPVFPMVVEANGVRVPDVNVTMTHNGREIAQGVTDKVGAVRLYGAAPGDIVEFGKTLQGGPMYYSGLHGQTVVTADCAGQVVPLKKTVSIVYVERPRFRIPHHMIEISIPIFDNPANLPPIEVLAGHPGLQRRPVTLKFDSVQGHYFGRIPFDAARGPELDIVVRTTTPDGLRINRVNTVRGALFHPNGPGTGPGAVNPMIGGVYGSWSLFSPDAPIDLRVRKDSMAEGTSVTVTRTVSPGGLPSDWVYVSQPTVVEGDHPLRSGATLRLKYDTTAVCAEDPCVARPDTFRVVRFDGKTWIDLPVADIDSLHQSVSADIREWGIYAVISPVQP